MKPIPENNEIVPLTIWFSRRSSGVFFLPSQEGGDHGVASFPEDGVRSISLFMRSRALDTSSVTCSILRLLTISLSFGNGPRSLRAIASLSVSALPITLRLAPHERQYCRPDPDSVPH